MAKWIIGVDEAGRGPLAGPVAVGIVKVSRHYDISKYFPDAKDSKILSEKKREEIYKRMQKFAALGKLEFTVIFATAGKIDTIGITKAVHHSIYKGIGSLAPDATGVEVFLDGLLHAPSAYKQQTIIKGDAKVAIISLASIAAKVRRDRLMKAYAKKYPLYGFEIHKGYGTLKHRKQIKKHGLCALHRESFCKNLKVKKKVSNSFDHA
jgi:ribonuclease HII